MNRSEIIRVLKDKLKAGISMNVQESYGIYECSFRKDGIPLVNKFILDKSEFSEQPKYFFEFNTINDLHAFNTVFEWDIDYLAISQEAYEKFCFIYYYLFGIKANFDGYPEKISDLIEYFHSDSDTYHYGFVVTAENNSEPLRVTSTISYNLETKEFAFELNFLTNLPYKHENYYMECSNVDKFNVKLLTDFACKPLNKTLNELKLIDSTILKIINYG